MALLFFQSKNLTGFDFQFSEVWLYSYPKCFVEAHPFGVRFHKPKNLQMIWDYYTCENMIKEAVQSTASFIVKDNLLNLISHAQQYFAR